jgi:hypothetical protein
MQHPIVVLSFGRSGSTWISDIISKNMGGLLLFEPLHPETCPFPQQACYSSGYEPELAGQLLSFLEGILAKEDRNRWLLRNHLFNPLEAVSQTFVDMVWEETQVLGFKEIRANFMIDWFIENLNARIVYLVRHPAAVIASLRRRKNFWNEFGFETHWQLFMEHVVHRPANADILRPYLTLIAGAETQIEREAVMWSVTHKLAAQALARHGLPIFHYEDFYERAFPTTRQLVSYLGGDPDAIHPAHIFVPSMTTIRTVHGLTASESDFASKGWGIFWDGILSSGELTTIMDIVAAFDIEDYGEGWILPSQM